MRKYLDDFANLSHLRTSSGVARWRQADDEDLILADSDAFRQDADMKLILSKAFRQLMFKTQVVSSPINCLIRNRASHTFEVASLATLIADILGLNVNLARSIAFGHDIGHVPFGHAGEDFLSKVLGEPFRHEVFGVIRAQKIERLGKGLNVTHQTLSGIRNHSRGSGKLTVYSQMSAEAKVVMFSDKISYILSDYNDIVKRRLLPDDETKEVTNLISQLGNYQRERANRLVLALCQESIDASDICFGKCFEAQVFEEVKKQMYKLYGQVNSSGAEEALERVYNFVQKKVVGVNPALILALMNDQDVLYLSSKIIFDRISFNQTSVAEQLPHIRKLDPGLSLTDPDLDW